MDAFDRFLLWLLNWWHGWADEDEEEVNSLARPPPGGFDVTEYRCVECGTIYTSSDYCPLCSARSPAEPYMAGPDGISPPKTLRDEFVISIASNLRLSGDPVSVREQLEWAFSIADIFMQVRKEKP